CFFQAEDGIRDRNVTGVQTCALPILFAKVPRIITSWFPRREPYELKSLGDTPCSISHFPAGVSLPMAPAGEMWSVVTESPNLPSTRRPLSGSTVPASLARSWKNVGFWM